MASGASRVRSALKSFYGENGPPREEADRSVPSGGLTKAEQCFFDRAKAKGRNQLIRGGWPDFLMFDDGGSLIGVEVKSDSDRLSESQIRCFSALESTGLRVFVWHAKTPDVLVPWRKWFESFSEIRGKPRNTEANIRIPTSPFIPPRDTFEQRRCLRRR